MTVQLAPTFDHGAGLARNLLDSEREERLGGKVKDRTIEAFVRRGRSAFYKPAGDDHPLGLREAFLEFSMRVPEAARQWVERLRAVQRDAVSSILESIPHERMSDVTKQFTLELLMTNQRYLTS
jgi:hypothetical protein